MQHFIFLYKLNYFGIGNRRENLHLQTFYIWTLTVAQQLQQRNLLRVRDQSRNDVVDILEIVTEELETPKPEERQSSILIEEVDRVGAEVNEEFDSISNRK